jgi:branched-chain amino acid transport system permease protein
VARPRIGVDEWVASVEGRREQVRGPLGAARRTVERVPLALRVAPLVAFAAVFPFLTDSDFVVRVALNTLLFALLAMGLNTVVGWAGLLDLGYVAFYGFGGYLYAMLASDHFGVHLATEAILPIVVAASALLGLLLGLPSRRLVGDYLAIVTLFFAQIFVVLTTNGNRITLPGDDEPTDISGGPNGITNVDQFEILGVSLDGVEGYYWFALVSAVAVLALLAFANESRTGRAWRAVREDSLAAELMSMPVNWLKLLAFMCGAAVAGYTGTIFAAVQTGVFPTNFDLPLLITVYAMAILGGAGSLTGVILGAIVVNTVLEVLTTPEQARIVFYVGILVAVLGFVRPWWRVGAIAAGTVVLGIVAFQLADAVRPAWTSGVIEGGWFSDLLDGWVIHPAFPEAVGKYTFVAAVVGVVGLTQLRGGIARTALAPAVIYAGIVAWEGILIDNPSVTRLILLGATLVLLMTRRPEGLIGQKRVEIV